MVACARQAPPTQSEDKVMDSQDEVSPAPAPLLDKLAATTFTKLPLLSFLHNTIKNSRKTGSKALHLDPAMTGILLQLIDSKAKHQHMQLQLIE